MGNLITYKFLKEDYTLESKEEVINDGIGSYEFWGAPGFDKGESYISGVTSLFIDGDDTDDNIKEFIDIYKDEIEEILLPGILSNEIFWRDKINFFKENGKIEIYIEYEAAFEEYD